MSLACSASKKAIYRAEKSVKQPLRTDRLANGLNGPDRRVKAVLERARSKGKRQQTLKHDSAQLQGTGASFNVAKLSPEAKLQFERSGHLTVKQLLARSTTQELQKVIEDEVNRRKLEALRHRVRVLCPHGNGSSQVRSIEDAERDLAQSGIKPVGFLQFFNTWRVSDPVKGAVCSGPLAQTAACLLGAKSVRLYQDCVFLKEPGYSETNWHSDLRMAPFDTNSFITAWIPLRPIRSNNDSGLMFAKGSHRDFALPFWRRGELDALDLSSRQYPIGTTGSMAVGDVSWHAGWTLHCSPQQPRGTQRRLALSVSYFTDGARLLPAHLASRKESEDLESYSAWLKDLKGGAKAEHRLLPLVESNC